MNDLAEKILDPSHRRANVRAMIAKLEECHIRGIPVSEQLAAAVPVVCAQLLRSESPRVKAAGAKLVVAALKHNLELAAFADKTARLDAGMATDNHAVVKMYGITAPTEDV